MEKKELTTEELALIELCVEPQSFEAMVVFLGSEEKYVKGEIRKLKRLGVISEIKGPTYDLWESTKKGRDILQL